MAQAHATISKLTELLKRIEAHKPGDSTLLANDLRAAADLLTMHEDAELVQLGYKIEPLIADIAAVQVAYNESWERSEEEALRRMGLDLQRFWSDHELERYHEQKKQLEKESGTDALWDELNSMWERAQPLMDRIRALPALTPAAVAAKALMVAAAHPEIWMKDADDLEFDELFLKDLIEAACAVGGIHPGAWRAKVTKLQARHKATVRLPAATLN